MGLSSHDRKGNASTSETSRSAASAGPNGVSLAPPAYGIESVDRATGQNKPEAPVQRKARAAMRGGDALSIHTPNQTGLPDSLKSGVESLSGFSLDDVRVYYNSPKPMNLNALAYTQGTDIHVAPGQERHLPHEAWHVVQQKQGRVRPTLKTNDVNINDDAKLEKEADLGGARSTQTKSNPQAQNFGQGLHLGATSQRSLQETIQCAKSKTGTNKKVGLKKKQTKGIKKPKHTRPPTPKSRYPKRTRRAPFFKVEDTPFYKKYGNLSATGVSSEDTGTSVEYVIGPRSGGYLGSTPDTSIMQNTIQWLDTNLPTANQWIRGHLLNDWLGGSGKDNENLAPMSHTTNQQWNRNFEQKLKTITETLHSFYFNNNATNYFILVGYRATASGNYGPASLSGVNIPDQFDGDWYYAAYDRINGGVAYDNSTVQSAFRELNSLTRNAITNIEGGIVTTTMQTH